MTFSHDFPSPGAVSLGLDLSAVAAAARHAPGHHWAVLTMPWGQQPGTYYLVNIQKKLLKMAMEIVDLHDLPIKNIVIFQFANCKRLPEGKRDNHPKWGHNHDTMT